METFEVEYDIITSYEKRTGFIGLGLFLEKKNVIKIINQGVQNAK
jgi:hypothetical protein